MIGTVVAGRYQVLSLLGQGGMAKVFRAKDINLDRDIALKMLHETIAKDDDFRQRFSREAKASAKLAHPNIVQVYDYIECAEGTFITMELVEGKDLRDYMKQHGRLSIDESISIIVDVLKALQEAHDHGIVHRDVSARNVLIGKNGSVKVSDFGIARVVGERTLTQAGDLVGSVQYISPEQARGDEAGASADIYSCGVLLYEMLTGQLPFLSDNVVKLALKHIQEIPQPPSAKCPEISTSLDAIVLTAMAKDPLKRYLSAYDMVKALYGLKNPLANVNQPLSPAINLAPEMLEQTLVKGAFPQYSIDDMPTQKPGSLTLNQIDPASYDEDYEDNIEEGNLQYDSYEDGEAVDGEDIPPTAKEPISSKSLALLITVFTAAFLALVGGVTWVTMYAEPRVQVPSLVNMSYTEAQKVVEALGLTLQVQKRVLSDKEDSLVLEQEPKADSMLDKGSVIYVTVSGGAAVVYVPNLDGLTEDRAVDELRVLGLEYIVKHEESSQIGAGIVLRQEPTSGSEVRKGTPVTVYVSSGEGSFALPDITGLTPKEAAKIIEGLGGKLSLKGEKFADKLGKGLIVEQEIAPGSKMKKGQSLGVYVSKGQELKAVPDFTGKTVLQAKELADSMGLVVTVEGGGSDHNAVSRQEPRSGEMSDGTVKLWSFARAVVPGVCGMPYEQAVGALKRAGLTVGTVSSVSSQSAPGTVLSQSLNDGIEAEFETAVDLTVAAQSAPTQAPAAVEPSAPSAPVPHRVQPPVHQPSQPIEPSHSQAPHESSGSSEKTLPDNIEPPGDMPE